MRPAASNRKQERKPEAPCCAPLHCSPRCCALAHRGAGGGLSGSPGARGCRLRRRQRPGHPGPHGRAGARQQPRPAVLRREQARRERHDRGAVGRDRKARRLFAAVHQLVDHLRRPTSTKTSATTRSPISGRSPPPANSTACSCWSTRNRRSRRWRSSSPSPRRERVLYGSPGVGNGLHLAAEIFTKKAGITLQQSPTRARPKS